MKEGVVEYQMNITLAAYTRPKQRSNFHRCRLEIAKTRHHYAGLSTHQNSSRMTKPDAPCATFPLSDPAASSWPRYTNSTRMMNCVRM